LFGVQIASLAQYFTLGVVEAFDSACGSRSIESLALIQCIKRGSYRLASHWIPICNYILVSLIAGLNFADLTLSCCLAEDSVRVKGVVLDEPFTSTQESLIAVSDIAGDRASKALLITAESDQGISDSRVGF
jgi:hypothetical protein